MNAHTSTNAYANVRTFRAPDARSALSAVRAAFGGEAVILKTRELTGGIFRHAQIEVTAASAGLDAPSLRKAAFEEGPTGEGGRAAAGAADLRSEVTALRRVVEEMGRRIARNGQPEMTGNDGRAVETADEGPRFTGEAFRVYKHLMRRGVEEPLARGLVEEARRIGAGGRTGEVEEAVKAAMRKQLAPAPAPWLGEGRRTIALIGPTGVGKTTAIAKIAARAVLETKFKVALITVDAYRVGASDQLARYGKIMGIPTCVARDQAALAEAVSRFQTADLVLIDTAGRSDNESLAAQTTLLRSVPNVQLHLVLSAATGGRELAASARRFRAIAPERVIFSKIDEADGPGAVYSAVATLPRPISCITDGQRVPEDIHPVTGPDLVALVFGK
jgi:flagellar biosynthesis protein FlhF